jgi:hypothetical protein
MPPTARSAPSIARARWLGTLNTKLTRVTSAARDAYAEVDLGYDVPAVRFLPIAQPRNGWAFLSRRCSRWLGLPTKA